MAVSTTNTAPQLQALSLGNVKARLVTCVFDDDYATPSTDELVASDVGLHEILFVHAEVDAGTTAPGTADGAGFVAQYDYEANGLRMFEAGADAAALDEVADSTGSSAVEGVSVRCLVLGF